MSSDSPIPLNEFITLQRGFDLPSQNRQRGSIPVVASTNTVDFHNEAKVKAPGVVIGRSGSIGGGQYIQEDFWPLNTTLWVKDFKGHEPRYIYYLLKNIDFTRFNVGSGVPTLNRNHLSSILINDIGTENEKKIAHILSTLDNKIELNRKMNQTLEEMASAIFKSWFVDFDPVNAKANCEDEAELENIAKELGISKAILDLFPSEFEESEMGIIPKGWEVSKLGNILLLLESGSRPKGGIDPTLKDGFASIGAESINGIGNFNFQSIKYITSEFFNSLKRGIVSDYDVLVYKDGAYIGKKAMFGNGFPFSNYAINEHVFILRSNDLANQFFLYFLLEQDKLALLNTNSAQPGLNQESMKNYQIILPDIKIITAFEKIVKNLVDKILVNSMEIKTLEKTRDTLLPKLLSGEIEV